MCYETNNKEVCLWHCCFQTIREDTDSAVDCSKLPGEGCSKCQREEVVVVAAALVAVVVVPMLAG